VSRFSSLLVNFMARREGIVLVPYRDGGGWSVLCGHYLGKMVPPEWKSREGTPHEAFKLLKEDIERRVAPVEKILAAVLDHVEQSQFDAVLDLYYQGGSDGLEAVAKVMNTRDLAVEETCLTSDRETCRELLNWDTNAAGEHMRGLFKRAGRRVAMYAAAEYGSDLSEIPMWREVDRKSGRPTGARMETYRVVPGDFA
jgi:GH24 family phage-related lysozyme (muramidase)